MLGSEAAASLERRVKLLFSNQTGVPNHGRRMKVEVWLGLTASDPDSRLSSELVRRRDSWRLRVFQADYLPFLPAPLAMVAANISPLIVSLHVQQ